MKPRASPPLWLAAVAAPLLLACAAVAAAPAIDADLLEFLGSVDSDEPGWHDFLADNDVKPAPGKPVAVKPPASAPTPPPAATPPASKVKET
jgi:hypothetical protein